MTHPFAALDDRAVISVAGPEARSFLQGIITNDINELQPGAALYAALLTPQGKVLFDFIVSEREGAALLDCCAADLERLLKRLTMYRLRARVDIQPRDDLSIVWSPEKPSAGEIFADPRMVALGYRSTVPRERSKGMPSGADEYLGHRLRAGVPEGIDFGSDKMFALDAGLEELHGVSFEKGCYVGQELTARMKHRGTARKRLLPILSMTGANLAAPGAEIRIGPQVIGEITSTYGDQGFGLVRLDRWREAGAAEGLAGDQPIAIQSPAWLHLDA